MKRSDPRHGTKAGYENHKHEGKQPCRPCLDAHAAYIREYRARTTEWRARQSARQRALGALARRYPGVFRRLYEAELERP